MKTSQSTIKTFVTLPAVNGIATAPGKRMALTGIERFFPELRFPEHGITFLYGNRNPADPYIGSLPQEAGKVRIRAAIKVNIGGWLRHKAGLEPGQGFVGDTELLNLASSKRDIIQLAQQVIEDSTGQPLPEKDWPRRATAHPELVGHLIEHEAFAHLSTICYTVKHPLAGEFQVATVFNLQAVDLTTVQGVGLRDLFFYFGIAANNQGQQ